MEHILGKPLWLNLWVEFNKEVALIDVLVFLEVLCCLSS